MGDLFRMPIQDGRVGYREDPALAGPFVWVPTKEDRRQADRNHGQTLERLAQRGGMSWCEMLAIVNHRPWRKINDHAAAKAACEANVRQRSTTEEIDHDR